MEKSRNLTLSNRRIAVISCLVSLLVFYSMVELYDSNTANLLTKTIALLALCLLISSCFYLFRKTGIWHLGNAPNELLDERQIQVRNDAYRYGYMIIAVISIALLSSYRIFTTEIMSKIINSFSMTFCIFAVILPALIIAWHEKEV